MHPINYERFLEKHSFTGIRRNFGNFFEETSIFTSIWKIFGKILRVFSKKTGIRKNFVIFSTKQVFL